MIALIYMFAFALLLNTERDLKTFLYPVVVVAARHRRPVGDRVRRLGQEGKRSPYLDAAPGGPRPRAPSATRTSSPG